MKLSTMEILQAIASERKAQEAKWGEQHHPDGTDPIWHASAKRMQNECQAAGDEVSWKLILEEEVCEAFAETDPERLVAELVQVAAVCAAWIEDVRSR